MLWISSEFLSATEGGTATASSGAVNTVVSSGSLLAAFTLTMPPLPLDKEVKAITGSGGGVTLFNLLPNSGQSFDTGAAITTLLPNTGAMYVYRGSNSTWYRIGV